MIFPAALLCGTMIAYSLFTGDAARRPDSMRLRSRSRGEPAPLASALNLTFARVGQCGAFIRGAPRKARACAAANGCRCPGSYSEPRASAGQGGKELSHMLQFSAGIRL